jgi:hypothetical protein
MHRHGARKMQPSLWGVALNWLSQPGVTAALAGGSRQLLANTAQRGARQADRWTGRFPRV